MENLLDSFLLYLDFISIITQQILLCTCQICKLDGISYIDGTLFIFLLICSCLTAIWWSKMDEVEEEAVNLAGLSETVEYGVLFSIELLTFNGLTTSCISSLSSSEWWFELCMKASLNPSLKEPSPINSAISAEREENDIIVIWVWRAWIAWYVIGVKWKINNPEFIPTLLQSDRAMPSLISRHSPIIGHVFDPESRLISP